MLGLKQKKNGEASIIQDAKQLSLFRSFWTYLGLFIVMTLTWSFEMYSLRLKYSYESKIVIDFIKLFTAIVIFVIMAQKKLTTLMKRYDTLHNATGI